MKASRSMDMQLQPRSWRARDATFYAQLMLSVATADTNVIRSHGKTDVGTAIERLCHLQQGQHRNYVTDLCDALHSQVASEQRTL